MATVEPVQGGPGLDSVLRDLQEAREQMRATGEVLRALGRSASDLDHVFGAVVHNARRLCHADAAQLHLYEAGSYRSFRLADHSGLTEEFRAFMEEHPILADRRTLVGRVGLDRTTLQIPDVLADPEYGRVDAQRLGHYRSILGAPMLVGDDAVGVLSVWRNQVDPFSDRAVELLSSFAAQAAIAVQTAGLVKALEERGGELGRKVDQLEALGAVGEAVSSSLDLDEVLSTIVTNAVGLSRTDGGSILEFDPGADEFHVRTAFNTSPDVLDALRRIRVGLFDTSSARPRASAAPCRRPTWPSVRTTCTCGCCVTRGGVPWWPCPCSGRTASWVLSWCVAARPGRSTTRPARSCRPSPANPPSRSSTPNSTGASRSRARSWRWPAGTSRSSSPRCPMSFAPRSTPSSASPRYSWRKCSAS